MRSRLLTSALTLVVLGGAALPAGAAHEDSYGAPVSATWETSIDGGMRTDQLGEFATTSYTQQPTGNPVAGVFVTGTALKNNALQAAGVKDFDIVTTMFDATTGAVRWTNRYDHDLGSFSVDRPVGIEVNYNNTTMYVLGSTADGLIINTHNVGSSEGKILNTWEYGAAPTINDTGISVAGSNLFAVGTSAGLEPDPTPDFHVLRWATGSKTLTLDDRPVKGVAHAVDAYNDYTTGNINAWRTLVAVGREDAASSGAYVAAYETGSAGTTWTRRPITPATGIAEATAVDVSYDRAGRRGVAFVSGRTGSNAAGWDIWVVGYDTATGAPLWNGPNDGIRMFDSGGVDAAVDLVYSWATQRVYVVGTADRGAPHAQDIVTLAFDATTGDRLAVAYAAGDISNGRDTPTDVTVTGDGQRIFVSGRTHTRDTSHAYRAGVFAYDPDLHVAGTAFLSGGGASLDAVAGIGLSLDGSHLLLGGASDLGSTRLDHTGAAFPVADFVPVLPDPDPVATTLTFTDASAATGTVGDPATLEVSLVDASGAPVVAAEITISFDGGAATPATTGSDGLARLEVTPTRGGTVDASANFVGSEDLLASAAQTQLAIARRGTTLQFTDATDRTATVGDEATAEVVLLDAATGEPIAEHSVVITAGDGAPRQVDTDANGVARVTYTPSSAGNHDIVVNAPGTEQREPAQAATTVEVVRRGTLMTLVVEDVGVDRTVTAGLFDRDGSALAGRTITFLVDGQVVATATTGSDGRVTVSAPPGTRGRKVVWRAEFVGDASHAAAAREASAA